MKPWLSCMHQHLQALQLHLTSALAALEGCEHMSHQERASASLHAEKIAALEKDLIEAQQEMQRHIH